MVMECKLCDRKFSNGKALGGHMRSHFVTLPLPPKTPQRQEPTDSTSSIVVSCEEEEDDDDKSSLVNGLRRRESEKLVDPDREMRCKKRPRELEMEEEDVASCLVMMSRDVWRGEDDEMMREKVYKCDKCERVFKSSQGLGSHRTNQHHNKIKSSSKSKEVRKVEEEEEEEDHECGFCGKVFRSGKALGGHKRVHMQHLPSKPTSTSTLVQHHSLIDLNLPPPPLLEDEDEDEDEDEEFHKFSVTSGGGGERKW